MLCVAERGRGRKGAAPKCANLHLPAAAALSLSYLMVNVVVWMERVKLQHRADISYQTARVRIISKSVWIFGSERRFAANQ